MPYSVNGNCSISKLKEAIRIFYDNLNWFFSRFYADLNLVLDFFLRGASLHSIVSCCNLRMKTSLTTVSLEVLTMQQSKNYDKVPSRGACLYFFLFRFSLMFCFYKRVVASHSIHTILNYPLVQLLHNMNCWKTDLNFAFLISGYNPLVTIQAVMHEITADPAVLSNWTLGWNRWHIINCQQIHLQMLTCQIRSWSGTPATSIQKERYLWNRKWFTCL